MCALLYLLIVDLMSFVVDVNIMSWYYEHVLRWYSK